MKVIVTTNTASLLADEGVSDTDIRRALWALWTTYDTEALTYWKQYEQKGDENG